MASYIDAFFGNLDWAVVNNCVEVPLQWSYGR